MAKPAGFTAHLAIVCLASVAWTSAVSAEEITVTVPLDTPAKVQPATPAPAAPRATAAASETPAPSTPTLPAFAGGNNLMNFGSAGSDSAKADAPAKQPAKKQATAPATLPDTTGSIQHNQVAEDGTAADAATPPQKPKPKVKSASTGDAASKPAAPAEKKAKEKEKASTKQAKSSSCKGLEQDACGAAKGCKWSVPKAPSDPAAKPAAPHCVASASKPKKKKKPADTAAKGEVEVLPWAKKSETSKPIGEFSTKTTSATKSAAHKAKSATQKAAQPATAAPANSADAQ